MSTAGKVYLVDDEELVVASLSRALKKEGFEVRTGDTAQGLVEKISSWSPDVTLLDIGLPGGSGLDVLEELKSRGVDTEVVMLTGDDTAGTAIQAMKAGAADYVTKPFELEKVRFLVRGLVEKHRLKEEVKLRRVSDETQGVPPIVGHSDEIEDMRGSITKIARAGVDTVLLTGESGTGKEVVARNIHHIMHDGEDYAPFVGLNCTALPDSLVESELFGHEKGAFTDAKADKKGVFELAEGGTLLLDEIGDMPLTLQGKLLRVLEERVVRRLGGGQDIAVRATVVASTNRDLKRAVEENLFREDLYYRLNAFSLRIPALRERGDDILELAAHFANHFAAKYGKQPVREFTPECREFLLAYSWPGNVRELRNVMERIVVLEGAEVIGSSHLPREITEQAPAGRKSDHKVELPSDGTSLEEVKRDLIVQALERSDHNKAQAARLLDISYETLRYQMKRFGIK